MTVDQSVSFHGWASRGTSTLEQWSYHPRPLGKRDVELAITHCGICGSDIHTMTQGWGPLQLGPCITGHEIVGTVVARGDEAPHALGDRVGVGAMVDSCKECEYCKAGLDQQCTKSAFTYNDKYKEDGRPGITYGGYADRVRVPGDWAFKIPEAISSAEAAPLMCAGITTYAPLARYGAGPDKRVGVLGLGGLGHLGVQWAAAFKSKEVVVISTSDSKREEAKKLGATRFVNSRKPEEMAAAAGSIDLLIITSFGTDTDYNQVLSLVANNGTCVLLAVPEKPISLNPSSLIHRHINFTGSLIGGRAITQEMLEFAAKHNVRPWIEKMPMSDANAAVKHMIEGSPRYRIVMYTEAAKEL
ncbi:hypothetical protein BGW41_007158 [Actinomortierella wolfii]|nr:hypothetical protein BGW41_007158 [Actinomortierella wolfii]